MADAQQSTQQHDDDVIGKAYDSRLMRRLLTYLRPYRLQVGVSLVAILLKAGSDVLGPYLTKVAIDLYMTQPAGSHGSLLARHLSRDAVTGITEIAGIYLASLGFSYVLEFVQTYLMQWTGQKVMYDLRSQIFRHIQSMHVAFFDRNPTGRLVTRVTSDVDALNEMFTSGVVSIFEDVLVLAGIVFVMLRMNWWLALLAFSVIPFILIATQIFRNYVRESYRRIRTAIARINSYLQEHVSGMSVVQLFNREERAFQDFEKVNLAVHAGVQGRHPGLRAVLSRGRNSQLHCDRHHSGDGRRRGAAGCGSRWACWWLSSSIRSDSSVLFRT